MSTAIDINISLHKKVPSRSARGVSFELAEATAASQLGDVSCPGPTSPVPTELNNIVRRRRDIVRNKRDAVHKNADKGDTVVEAFQYGHELKHQLNSSTKGTHPALRNKFDKHLIDVIRNTHSHLLNDVHSDIMKGIIEARIERQLAAMNKAMAAAAGGGGNDNGKDKDKDKGNGATSRKKKKKKRRGSYSSDNHTDLEAYASRMFAVSGVMMRDGIQDRNFVSHKYDELSLWYYEVQYKRPYQVIMTVGLILLTVLVLIETPHAQILGLTLPLEILCLFVQMCDIFVRARALRHPLQEHWLVLKSLCLSLCALDWIVQVVCAAIGPTEESLRISFHFRVLRCLRVVFWIEYYSVLRREFGQAAKTVKKIIPAILLVLACVLFFAGLGIAMFPRRELALALGIDMTEGDLYYKDILSACIQLWYLFAGAVNFPDVMLPAFIQNDQWWYVVLVVVYFLFFLIISVFVLQNILIATVVEMHRDIEIRDIIARYLRKHLAFAAAFEVIYNVQDLEHTRFRLKRAIRNKQLNELDSAITDTMRLQAKLPIVLPEKVHALKLLKILQEEEREMQEEKEKQEKKKEQEEREAREEQERKENVDQTAPARHTHRPPPRLAKRVSSRQKIHMNNALGEVDIESQRLHKATFLRAMQQLGQEVLFKQPPAERISVEQTGEEKEREHEQENQGNTEGQSVSSVRPERKVFGQQSSIFSILGGGNTLDQQDSSFINWMETETEGRVDEVWSSIYTPDEDMARDGEKSRSNFTIPHLIEKVTEVVKEEKETTATTTTTTTTTTENHPDALGTQTVDVNSFMKLPDVLVCKYGDRQQIQAAADASKMDRFCTGGLYRRLRPIVGSMWFDTLCIVSVICSFIIEVFIVSLESVNQMVYLDAGKSDLVGFIMFNVVDIGLSIFFIFEAIIRILAIGWKGYWSNPWWRVDGIIAIFTFFIVFIRLGIVISVTQFNGMTVLMLISCLRGVRIVKFFTKVPSIKVILVTVSKVARKSSHFFWLLIALYYVFSIIGIHLCNRELTMENQVLHDTTWYTTTYQVSNKTLLNSTNITSSKLSMDRSSSAVQGYVHLVHFQTFGNAMFTLFHLTFLNNWHVTAEAVMTVVMARYETVLGKTIAKTCVFFYFICIFILGWVLVMNVFISKFLEGYVEAKQAMDEKKKRRRLTSVLWVVNEDGEKEPKSVPMNPDKQIVLDGLHTVFPTMHIKKSHSGPSVAGEHNDDDEDDDDDGASMQNGGSRHDGDGHHKHHRHRHKKYCVICYAQNRSKRHMSACETMNDCLKGGRVLHRCELCLSPVCGRSECSVRVIAPLLVLEVSHVQKMKKLYGQNFHNGRVWEPLRLCSLCLDDWEEDIDTDAEIYREAELLHADNEQLADEVLGTKRGNEDDDNILVELNGENGADVPTTPMGGIDLDRLIHQGGAGGDVGQGRGEEKMHGVGEKLRPEALPQTLPENLKHQHENVKHHRRRSSVLRMQLGGSSTETHSLDL